MQNYLPLLIIFLGIQAAAEEALFAEIPVGYEVIEITSADTLFSPPHMNICGEIVWSAGWPPAGTGEVYKYDNGLLTQLTHSPLRDLFPDINDSGTIVWMNGVPNDYDIFRLENGIVDTIAMGTGGWPRINSAGHVTWYHVHVESCAAESDVYYFDGNQSYPITFDGRSNQSPVINDHDDLVWTSYDFCVSPWTSEIHASIDGTIDTLPTTNSETQGASINNLGVVAWMTTTGIELWQNGAVTVLTDWGDNPSINDHGDIYFIRFHQDVEAWQSWVYKNEEFYRLTDDAVWNADGDINEGGECTWHWQANINDGGQITPGGIRMLRRIRSGDIDNDGDVGLDDFSTIPECLTGPVAQDRLCNCRFFDMRHDRTVDLRDFTLFQNTFPVPLNAAEGCCTPHESPGCSDSTVASCVCDVLPSCCTEEWTDTCVVLVEQLKCGQCP